MSSSKRSKRFEGREVIGSRVAVTNTGDGLSEAMAIDDEVDYKIGDRVRVLMDCEVTGVGYVPVKDTNAVTRNHKFKAGIATVVDPEFGQAELAEQQRKIDEARAASKLEFPDGDEPEGGD